MGVSDSIGYRQAVFGAVGSDLDLKVFGKVRIRERRHESTVLRNAETTSLFFCSTRNFGRERCVISNPALEII